jgi:hypothetical protein
MAVRPVELEILLAYGADRWKKNARGATAAEELAVRLVSALHAKEGANDIFAKSSSSIGKRMSAGCIMKEVTLGKKKARQKGTDKGDNEAEHLIKMLKGLSRTRLGARSKI